MTPEEAIRRYAHSGDAEAFHALVRRYEKLVYAAASRRLSRREDVEDAAQQAFLGLARAAGSVPRDVAAWLYRAAQHAAIDVLRRNATRRRHEAAVEPMTPEDAPDAAEWRERSVAIDEAIAALPEADRSLVIEHFLAGRSQRELAVAFKSSQPTIQRRLEAAVGRLREHLAAHGGKGMLGASALVTHLPTMGQATVPAATSAELSKIALALPGKSVAAAGVGGTLGGKVAAAALLAAAAAVGIAILFRDPPPAPAPPAPPIVTPPAAPPVVAAPSPADVGAALGRLARAYRLADDQDVALVAPPYPAERTDFARIAYPQWRTFETAFGFGVAADGTLNVRSAAIQGNVRQVIGVARDILRLDWYEYDLRAIERLTARRPPLEWAPAGDWLVRDPIPAGRRIAGFARILSDWLGQDVRFVRSVERRPCLVLNGEVTTPARRIGDWAAVAVTGESNYAGVLDRYDPKDAWRADNRLSLNAIAPWLDAPLFQPADRPLDRLGPTRFIVGPDVRRRDDARGYVQLDHRSADYRARLVGVAEALAAQLGGTWTVEDRDIERWTATLAGPTPQAEGATP